MSKRFNGYKVNVDGMETFVQTEQKRITKALVRKICKALKFSTEDWMVADMWGLVREGVLEVKDTARHGKVFSVYTDGYKNTGLHADRIQIIVL